MLKKLLLVVALALPVSLFAQKFGTVNSEEILRAMPETTAAQQQLDEATKKYEAEFQKLTDELNKLYTDFQGIQNDANTPETIKERRMQEIQERGQKVEQFRQQATQDLQRQNEQLMAPIAQKINEAIKSVGQEGSFTFIFPGEPSLILYQGTDVIDVTPLVKTKLGLK